MSVFYINGKQRWITIGHWPQMSIKEARDEVQRVVAEEKRKHKDGITPDEEMGGFTWRNGLDVLETEHRKAGKASSTLKDYRCTARHIDHLLDYPMMSRRIEFRNELEKVHDAMKATPAAANMVLFLVSQIQSVVSRTRLVQLGPSPAKAITKHERSPRKFDVSETALLACWNAIQAITNPMRRSAFEGYLYSPLRKMELASIEHPHVLSDRTWVPRPKGGETRAFYFPLSRQLKQVIDDAATVRNPNLPWVFWSPDSHDGRIVNFSQTRGVWTPHRFRHHYRTIAHKLRPQVQFYEAELLMNHKLGAKLGDVAMGYINAEDDDFDRMAAANQLIADRIDEIIGR